MAGWCRYHFCRKCRYKYVQGDLYTRRYRQLQRCRRHRNYFDCLSKSWAYQCSSCNHSKWQDTDCRRCFWCKSWCYSKRRWGWRSHPKDWSDQQHRRHFKSRFLWSNLQGNRQPGCLCHQNNHRYRQGKRYPEANAGPQKQSVCRQK